MQPVRRVLHTHNSVAYVKRYLGECVRLVGFQVFAIVENTVKADVVFSGTHNRISAGAKLDLQKWWLHFLPCYFSSQHLLICSEGCRLLQASLKHRKEIALYAL